MFLVISASKAFNKILLSVFEKAGRSLIKRLQEITFLCSLRKEMTSEVTLPTVRKVN